MILKISCPGCSYCDLDVCNALRAFWIKVGDFSLVLATKRQALGKEVLFLLPQEELTWGPCSPCSFWLDLFGGNPSAILYSFKIPSILKPKQFTQQLCPPQRTRKMRNISTKEEKKAFIIDGGQNDSHWRQKSSAFLELKWGFALKTFCTAVF